MLAVDAVDVAQWPVTVAAVLAAVGVIWRTAVRPVIRWGRRIEAAVNTVEHEMTPNSGSSIKDAVDDMRGQVGQIHERLERGDARFDRIEARLSEVGPQQITIVNPSKEEPQ